MRRPRLIQALLLAALFVSCGKDEETSKAGPDAAAGDLLRGSTGTNPGNNVNDPVDDHRDAGAPDARP